MRVVQGFMGGAIATVIAISAWLPASAVTVREVINPRRANGGWVTDMAEVIRPQTQAELNRLISQLEAANGTEIAVVTVPQVDPTLTPKAFATELFNRWGIGKAGRNNGVLFLVSVGDRRVEIETGLGIEPILPNHEVQTIIDYTVLPAFREQQYDQGIAAGTRALVVRLDDSYNPLMAGLRDESPLSHLLAMGSIVLLIGSSRFLTRSKRKPVLAVPGSIERLGHRDAHNTPVQILLWTRLAATAGLATVVVFSLANPHKHYAATVAGTSGLLMALIYGVNRYETRRLNLADQGRYLLRPVHCLRCQTSMQRLSSQQLEAYLTPAQQTAASLDAMHFMGWACSACQRHRGPRPANPYLDRLAEVSDQHRSDASARPSLQGVHIRAYDGPKRSRYDTCVACQEQTMLITETVIQSATEHREGQGERTKQCQCCGQQAMEVFSIPRVVPDDNDSHSHSSSSGGSSFGGGSSSGGGAGGSW